MERTQVFKKVQEILEEQLGAAQPAEDAHIQDDLGGDSLDLIEMMIALEDGFGIDEIPDREAEKLTTVGEAVDYLMAIESVRGWDDDLEGGPSGPEKRQGVLV